MRYMRQNYFKILEMNLKWVLFTGILCLVTGIVLRKITDLDSHAIFLIILGLILKVYYIVHKIVTGEYKPGKEFIFLAVGLAFFMLGLYLKKVGSSFNPQPLMFIGIFLKVIFVVLFIRKIRTARKLKQKL